MLLGDSKLYLDYLLFSAAYTYEPFVTRDCLCEISKSTSSKATGINSELFFGTHMVFLVVLSWLKLRRLLGSCSTPSSAFLSACAALRVRDFYNDRDFYNYPIVSFSDILSADRVGYRSNLDELAAILSAALFWSEVASGLGPLYRFSSLLV